VAELFLSNDPPPRKGRPRWVDAAGLGAVVAAMLAIGVLGDRGAKDTAAPTPTTTSSTTSPFRRGTPYSETTTTEAPPTTTTVFRLGPLLPFRTDTVLLLTNGSSVLLVDVDGGTATRVPVAYRYGVVGVEEGFVLGGEGTFQILPSRGLPVRTVDLPPDAVRGRAMASGPRTFWSISDEPQGTEAVELDTEGRPTGRTVHLPAGVYLAGVLDDAVVVSGHGSLTVVDVRTGRPRSLGAGDVVAAHGRTVARLGCALLQCRLEVVDAVTGRARSIGGVPGGVGYVGQGTFSPDGRWLAFSVADNLGSQRLTVVSVATGRSWTADTLLQGPGPVAFSSTSDVVFAAVSGKLCAYRSSSGERHCLEGLDAWSAQELTAARAPG
jgi:hypothetical protein